MGFYGGKDGNDGSSYRRQAIQEGGRLLLSFSHINGIEYFIY